MSLTKLLDRFHPWLRGAGLRARPRLCVHLAPQQLLWTLRQGRHAVDAGAGRATLVNPGGHWRASVEALRALLRDPLARYAGVMLEVSLSSRWSQMTMVPWSDALLDDAGAIHFLRSQLAALYGDAARGWHIASDDAAYGEARLVCGIDELLLQSIRELAAECGHPCRLVEPVLCAALRSLSAGPRSAPQPRTPVAAIALVESGRITMAALDAGRIVALQSQPAGSAWPQELPQAWQRWTLRSPELADVEQVAVVELGDAEPPQSAASALTESLPPRFWLAPALFPASVGSVPAAAKEAA